MRQKFFCDNCGEEVGKDELRCPGCGRYFRSVKCPSCGFAGASSLFTDGCPSCGYAADQGLQSAGKTAGRKGRRRKAGRGGSLFSGRFYRGAIIILTLILAGLLFWYLRLLGS